MTHLADRPVRQTPRGGATLTDPEVADLLGELDSGWRIANGKLFRACAFRDFAEALAFANRVGAEAEAANHHPDLLVGWGKVEITLWTHTVGGLTEADFIVAAKCDRIS